MRKLPIYFLLILVLASLVSADTSWFTWGNNGFQGAGAGVDNILFGSNYPQGTTNLSNTSIVLANKFPSLVVDWDGDNQNEIFIFSGSTVSLYNNNLELVDNFGLGGTQSGKACIFNMDNDADLELAVLVGKTTIQIFQSGGTETSFVKSIPVSSADDLLCTVNWQGSEDTIWTVDAANTIIREIDAITNSETLIFQGHVNVDFCADESITDSDHQYSNPYILDDLNGDTKLDLIFILGDTGGDPPIRINSYNVVNNTYNFQNQTAFTNEAGSCNSTSVAVVQAGTSGSGKELLIRTQEGNSETHLGLFDLGGNFISGPISDGFKSQPALADIDADSLNEYCFLWNFTNVFCYNSVSNIPEYRWTIEAQKQRFFAIGEYDQLSDWQEIITPNQMYTPASAANGPLNEVLNLTLQDGTEPTEEAMVYPVSVEDQTQFFKDIIINARPGMTVFNAQEAAAVCGNGVCEIGESILTCPQDCTPEALADVEIVSVTINPSTATAWKNGTDASIDVTVNSKSGGNVAAQVILYFGSSFADEKPFVENQAVNSSMNFLFIANHTISSGIIRVIGRSEFDNTTQVEDFGFSVALNGVEFGDSIAVFDFTETPPIDPAAGETDTSDNAIVNMFNDIPTGGLGFDLLWYLIMVVVGMTIFIVGHQADVLSGSAMLGTILIVEVLLLIIGVKLGFVPVGIIIIGAILGAIVLALFLRKILFSSEA